jgi:drug/metabolite transporter (DMT)-like permease
MIGSAFAFSVMSLLVKGAGERLPSQEIVLARALVSLVLSWALLRRAGVEPWGQRRALLLLRGGLGFAGLSCVFFALTRLPLAAATVIQYLHPVFTAVLAAALLGERVGRRLPLSIALGLLGVVLVTRPAVLFGAVATPLDPFAVAVAVAGALLTACAYVVVRKLASAEHPLVIVLYFPLVTVPASLPALAGDAIWPRGWEWALLIGVGVFTQIGQVALTRGMQLEPAGRATALSYSQVLFASLWGVLFFGEIPGPWTAAGAALILASTLLTALDHDR